MTSVATGSFNGILYFVLQNMEALFAQRLKSGFMHVCIGKVKSPQESTCIGPQEDGNVFGAVLYNLRSPRSREFFLLLTTDLVKRYGSLTLVLKLECEEKKIPCSIRNLLPLRTQWLQTNTAAFCSNKARKATTAKPC